MIFAQQINGLRAVIQRCLRIVNADKAPTNAGKFSVDYSDSAISADLSVLTIAKSSASSLAETLTPDELA